MKILEDLHAFLWHDPSSNNCNTYFINGPQKILVDPGHEHLFGHVRESLADLSLTPSDIDLVIITTPWTMHSDMAVYAMEHGKHVASEVPAAATVKECWRLVETSERTRKHCIMLGNTCYMEFPLLTLNMARQGLFGELVHGDCAYIADKRGNPLAQSGGAEYLNLPGGLPAGSRQDGAVAQLGERVNGIHEVSGSIPLGSTNGKLQ